MSQDEIFMSRAIELAKKAIGQTSPNPMVGCVITLDNEIIGEGYHEAYGHAHAEVNAFNSLQVPKNLHQCTAYVTLEPCAHFGKTPPCADLLINREIGRVVIGCQDPFDEVDGKGIEKLVKAGIEVIVGVLENECRKLNQRFFTFHEQKRPFTILKWAQTNDGFLARENFDSKWISNPYSRQLVHKWRSEEDAILVGKNTALYDNPSLTVREWKGKNPIRVIIDHNLELSADLNVFDGSVRTLIFNTSKSEITKTVEFHTFNGSINNLLSRLYKLNIQSILVEGGANTLADFIEAELWDEARVFTSGQEFQEGIAAPDIGGLLLTDSNETGDRLEIYKYVR